MENQSLVPHPVDLVESDLADSRRLLAHCMENAFDLKGVTVNTRMEYMAAATRLLRHNAQAATLLLREAHTCLRDERQRPKPPGSVCRKRRPGETGASGWGNDYRDRYLKEDEAAKILKTTPDAEDGEKNSKSTVAGPNIRFP